MTAFPHRTHTPARAASSAAWARDHRIARSLQRVLLRTHPQDTLTGVSTAAFYQAALDEAVVGGDSFDAFPLSGDRVALAVADASGKGLSAAERVAEVRFALRAFLCEHRDHGQALSRLNDFLCDAQRLGRRDDGAFTTLTLAVLDGATGEMVCLCAGGEPPLVLRTSGTVETVSIQGAALGLFPGRQYDAAILHVREGDAVLLATDGITEARGFSPGDPQRSRSGAFLGVEGLSRLAAQAQKFASSPAASSKIGRSIFEGARCFAGGTFHDDACLLVARRGDC